MFGFGNGGERFGSKTRECVKQVSVEVKESPKRAGHGKSNVLPRGLRKEITLFLNPSAGGFFPATGAKSALAGEVDVLGVGAVFIRAGIKDRASIVGAAAKHFDDVIDDDRANGIFMLFIIVPPASAGL